MKHLIDCALAALAMTCSVPGLALGDAAPGLEPPQGSAPRAKVVVIGVDAASWNVLRPLMQRGLLPNLSALVQRGTSGELASYWPLRTPQVWTTVVTGKLPGQHGIWDHLADSKYNPPEVRSAQRRRLTTRDRRSKALWQLLGAKGLRTLSVGWIQTWPAEKVPGATIVAPVVSMRPGTMTTIKGSMLRDEPNVMEPAALWPVARDLIVESDEVSADDLLAYADVPPMGSPLLKLPKLQKNLHVLKWSLAREQSVERLTLGLFDVAQPDLLLAYFQCGDSLAHRFWIFSKDVGAIERRLEQHHLPKQLAPELKRHFGRVVEACWHDQDARIGRILARAAGEDTQVFVISDHGFGDAPALHRDTAEPYGGNHLDDGILIVAGPHVPHGVEVKGVSVVDIAPTVLHLLGLPYGEDMIGRPVAALFDAAWWRAHPPQSLPTYERSPQLKVPHREGYPSRAARPYATSR